MAIAHIDNNSFESEVLGYDGKVLVDFFATWCGPCKMMAPILEEIASEQHDVKICKVDVDDEPALATKYKVMSIPTLVLFDRGQEVGKKVGAMSKADTLKWLEQ